MKSGQLTLLETLHLNPSSSTSCLWVLGYLAPVNLSFHICKVGRILPALFTAQAIAVAGLTLTTSSSSALCFLSELSSAQLCPRRPAFPVTPVFAAGEEP